MVTNLNTHISLLELVQIQMHRESRRELGNLDRWEKKFLASKLEPIDMEKPSLREWNDVASCVLQLGPEQTKKAARDKLLAGLRAG